MPCGRVVEDTSHACHPWHPKPEAVVLQHWCASEWSRELAESTGSQTPSRISDKWVGVGGRGCASHCNNAARWFWCTLKFAWQRFGKKTLSGLGFLVLQEPFDIDNSEICALSTCLRPCNFRARRTDFQLPVFAPLYAPLCRRAFWGHQTLLCPHRRKAQQPVNFCGLEAATNQWSHTNTDAPRAPSAGLNSSCPQQCPAWWRNIYWLLSFPCLAFQLSSPKACPGIITQICYLPSNPCPSICFWGNPSYDKISNRITYAYDPAVSLLATFKKKKKNQYLQKISALLSSLQLYSQLPNTEAT